MSASTPEQLHEAASTERPESQYLTPQEHWSLTRLSWSALYKFMGYDDFQDAVRPGDPKAPASLHVIYPDQMDDVSKLKRKAARLVNSYNFMRKDGDPLDDYDEYPEIAFLVTDNRKGYGRIEPVGTIEALRSASGLILHSLLAMGGEPWNKDIQKVIKATHMPDGSSLPNLLDEAVQARMLDISLLSVRPSHRRGGHRHDPERDVMGILYNGLGLVAEAEGIERMVAAVDAPVLKGLKRLRGSRNFNDSHWHVFAGIEPLEYATRIKGSNKTTVATVDMLSWYADMAARQPNDHRMIWGHEYEKRGVEVVGMRPGKRYEASLRNSSLLTGLGTIATRLVS